jgi:putative addiction module killer protein
MRYSIEIYKTLDNQRPFNIWLVDLLDIEARSKIKIRLERVGMGNLGNYEPVGDGVFELKLYFGPGYRVYYSYIDLTTILILWGGTKGTQRRDIEKAKHYLRNFEEERKNNAN